MVWAWAVATPSATQIAKQICVIFVIFSSIGPGDSKPGFILKLDRPGGGFKGGCGGNLQPRCRLARELPVLPSQARRRQAPLSLRPSRLK
jgi:hypothetical protein